MVNTFIARKVGNAERLGTSLFEETEPVELWPGASESEVEVAIRAAYRQVLGNAHVMDSERLTIAESHLKSGAISVRNFVREVAQSPLYQSRFFDNNYRYRAIELNFKHLLGRAPESYEEMVAHSNLLDVGGFEAEIDSYIDSDEYQQAYGEDTVPFYRGYKTQSGKRMVGFTHIFKLLRGPSSSDKTNSRGNPSILNKALIANQPSAVIPPSSVSSYGGLTDVKKLLADVLKPKPQEPAAEVYTVSSEAYQTLQGQCEEMALQIEAMQLGLADLRRVAAIGQAQSNKWNAYSSSVADGNGESAPLPASELLKAPSESEGYESLQVRAQAQSQAIAILQKQRAQLQSLATIGEARLNKWRRRNFSS